MENKLKLYGFNNLTKALSFNIYDVCYAKTEREQRDYIKYIDQQYNSERLTGIMEKLTEMIGAHVLHISILYIYNVHNTGENRACGLRCFVSIFSLQVHVFSRRVLSIQKNLGFLNIVICGHFYCAKVI